MKHLAIFAVPFFALLTGCSTPAKVCGHLEELNALPTGGKVGCEVKWGRLKSADADKYSQRADCVLAAKSKEDVQKCK